MVQITTVKADGLGSDRYAGCLNNATPTLSWKAEGTEKNWLQKEYQVRIQYGDNEVSLFDPIQSAESSYISWPGRRLKSRESFSVSVRVTGEDGSTTEWSNSYSFKVGILNNEWHAPFIAAKSQSVASHVDKISPETLFRSPGFEVAKPVKRALIYSTAQGIYELEINGTKVSEDYLAPGWTSYKHRLLHQVYDVSDKLDLLNVIGARVASGWYSGFLGFDGGASNIYGDYRAISLELVIEYEDGTVQEIKTDDSWMSSLGPIVNAQLYNGETYDARLEVANWSSPQGDISEWKGVQLVPNSSTLIAPQSFGYVKVVDTLKPKQMITTPSGKTIFDFGQNSVGVLKLNKTKAPKGHKVTLKHAEVLEHGELGTRPLREAKATDIYIFKGDENGEEYSPRFTFHGFRYAQVENWPGELTLDSVELLVLSTYMEETGKFECSNTKLNRLFQNVFHSTRGNFLTIPSDCPQRDERMGWLGDIALFAPTALYLFDCYPFLRSWLEDVRYEQDENGGFPSVVSPDVIHAYKTLWNGIYAAIWQDATVIVPFRLFEATNNKDILKAQYDSARIWVEFIPKVDGKYRWDKIEFQLGDWLDPSAPPDDPAKAMTDPYLVADAFLYLIVTQLKSMAEALNKTTDVAKYGALAEKCRDDFREEYVTKSGRVVSDSQTAYALAITFGLLNEDELQYAGNRLSFLVQSGNYKIGTGFAGTPFITKALVRSGHLDQAYKMLLQEECPSWLYPVTVGATTVWERWDSMLPNGDINPGEMTSFNHYALGAVATWLYEQVGGISIAAPGWKKILFKPMPGGEITNAKALHQSPFGLVESSWSIENGVFKYDITVPLNTSALVVLPNGEVYDVGSGSYSYTIRI